MYCVAYCRGRVCIVWHSGEGSYVSWHSGEGRYVLCVIVGRAVVYCVAYWGG